MHTLIMSMSTKHYIEKMLVATTRRERWKAKKQFRIERREERKRYPRISLGLDTYLKDVPEYIVDDEGNFVKSGADVSAGIVEPPLLTIADLKRIIGESGL